MASELSRLTVAQIRQRIFEASATSSGGEGSLAGQLFHRTLQFALSEDHPAYWRLSTGEYLNPERWANSLYDLALGPEITRLQASLRENGAEVLAVWNATRSFARWFCGLLNEAATRGVIRYDPIAERWRGAETLFLAEVELAARLKEAHWSAEVEISGRADHLIRVATDRWCVVEFKLGAGHPESDAAQVCLYHELLGGKGSAALVHFTPDAEPGQLVISRESIMQARPALMALIAAMTGVADREAVPGDAPGEWPKAPRESDIELGQRLVRALHEFGADAKLTAAPQVGPTFVRYQLEPGRGVSAAKIEKQGANLQMRLQLDAEPMIGRASGRIVVDIQRPDREFVPFHALKATLEAEKRSGGQSRVLAGVDLAGKVHFIDLARDAPHLLVGGVPGGGKSEWLRCAVASLLLANTPDTLRLAVIDPKKNAFADLSGSKYLWQSGSLIDTPDGTVIPLLEDLIAEMGKRYDAFKQERADDLAHYAARTGVTLPRLVCVVDEFADLLMGNRKAEREEIERGFIRIAQMGRAAGIHLILATQRPSRQVVSGVLKANIPARVAFQVANRVESGVLLDQGGAQYLLGKGDLLLAAGGREPVRLQSAWTSDQDRKALFGDSKAASAGS